MDKDMMFDMRHGYIVLFFYPKKFWRQKSLFEAQKGTIFGFESSIFVWNCVKTNQKLHIWCWKPFIDLKCFCEILMKNRHFWGEKNAFFGMLKKFLEKKSSSHREFSQLRVLSEILTKKKLWNIFLITL